MIRAGTVLSSAGTALFISGFISLLGQIVILRELSVAFHGVELIYPVAIGGWLFFTAVGMLFGRPWPSENRIAAFFTFFAIFLLSGIVFIRGGGMFSGDLASVSTITPEQIVTFLFSLIPCGIISGIIFGELASLYLETRGSLEGAYGMAAAGGSAGGLLAALVIRYGYSNLSIGLLCALLSFAAAFPHFQKKTGQYGRLAVIVMTALTLVLIYKTPSLDMRLTGLSHPGLFFSGDFPSGRIAATYRGGDIFVFENDVSVFSTKDKDGARFAHLAALQHPEPRRILLIGSGWDGSVRELLLHKPIRIDVMLPVEDPYIRFRLPGDVRRSLADPAVHLSYADPREFFKHKGFAWDLIIIDLPVPLSCRTNRLYTREFFSAISARLYRGGVVAIRLPSMDSPGTSPNLILYRGVYRNIAAVFPKRLLLPGTTTMIASSFAPFHHSPEILADRIRDRGIESSHISPSIVQTFLKSADLAHLKEFPHGTDTVGKLDINPSCYTCAALLWTKALLPRAILPLLPDFSTIRQNFLLIGGIVGIALLLLFTGSRLRPNWQRTVLAAAGGFLGIASESLLILCCGAKEGVVYLHISLLLAAFMAGLAIGAPLFRDLTAKNAVAEKRSLMSIDRNRFWSATLLIGFMLMNAVAIGLAKGDGGNIIFTVFLSAASGFLTGGLFACANVYRKSSGKKSGFLYSANLIGGSLGALCAGLFLTPLLGLAATAMALIVIAATAFLLL
jgi:spermidine synthase